MTSRLTSRLKYPIWWRHLGRMRSAWVDTYNSITNSPPGGRNMIPGVQYPMNLTTREVALHATQGTMATT